MTLVDELGSQSEHMTTFLIGCPPLVNDLTYYLNLFDIVEGKADDEPP